MGLLATAARAMVVVLAGTTLAACYEPRLRDCTLSCSAASDCGGDQECAGGWCVAPGASCTGEDAGGGGGDDGRTIDARAIDARAIDARAIDAPTVADVELRIEVRGLGSVDGDQPGVTCAGPDGDCRFSLPQGTDIELTAIDGDDSFRQWREACDGQGRTCTLTLGSSSTRAKAEFEDSDGGDD